MCLSSFVPFLAILLSFSSETSGCKLRTEIEYNVEVKTKVALSVKQTAIVKGSVIRTKEVVSLVLKLL